MRNMSKQAIAKLVAELANYDEETDGDSNSGDPQALLDELRDYARKFDRHRPPSVETVPWDFSQNFDDGAEAIYAAGNLQIIRKALYEQRYPQLKAELLIPHDTTGNPAVEREVVRTLNGAGDPTISRDQPDDVPSVELSTGEADVKFYEMSLSYGYSDQEIAKAMYEGMPLQYQKAKWCRDIMARKKDTIAFIGEATIQTKGLLNSTGTTSYTTPASGAAGSKKFADKAPAAVILDLNAAADLVETTTNEIEECDTWLLPSDAFNNINTRMVGDGSAETILSFFRRTRGGDGRAVNVHKTVKSQAGKIPGVATGGRMVVYRNDPDKLQFKVPLQFFQKAPQMNGFKTTIYCRMRLGELALWVPASVCYADGVS